MAVFCREEGIASSVQNDNGRSYTQNDNGGVQLRMIMRYHSVDCVHILKYRLPQITVGAIILSLNNHKNMLEKEDLKQIEKIINTALDTKLDAKFDEKLDPIKQKLDNIEVEIKDIKDDLEKLIRMESEDIKASYDDMEVLRKRITDLENIVKQMQQA
jgi:DNA repair ATPase RecN